MDSFSPIMSPCPIVIRTLYDDIKLLKLYGPCPSTQYIVIEAVAKHTPAIRPKYINDFSNSNPFASVIRSLHRKNNIEKKKL